MVASVGYANVLFFKEVDIGGLFADSKTGKEYIKIDGTTGIGDGHSRHSVKGETELFEPSHLVYTNFLREGWLS